MAKTVAEVLAHHGVGVEHADKAGDFLEHYGVRGMKWGVHRDRSAVEVTPKTAPGRKVKATGGKFHEPSQDAIRAAVIRQQAKKSTTDSLSNKELQDLVTRMNLEAQYNNLNHNNVGIGKKLTRLILGEVGDKEVNQIGDFVGSHYGDNAAAGAKVGVKIAKSAANGKKKK